MCVDDCSWLDLWKWKIMKNLCTTQSDAKRSSWSLTSSQLSIQVAQDKWSSCQSPRAWPYDFLIKPWRTKPWKLTCWPSSSGIKAKTQKKNNRPFKYHWHTWTSDEWSQKKTSGSLCAILFYILHLERIASHRTMWLSWNSPEMGDETQDSHNWPFFSSHVTISMSLWLFASLPKFLLMTVDRLRQNWVFSQSSEIFIWQQQCCVMAVTKMDIKICKPENYMYSWSTLSILILKISIMKTQVFLHRLWGIMESGSVTLQHISRSYQLQGTLPRCARCSHQGHQYHRTAAPDFLQQLSRPFLLASKSSLSRIYCTLSRDFIPLCLLKDSNSCEMMLGLKRPAPECSLHIDRYCLGTQSFPMHICNIPWHSKASENTWPFHFKHVQTKFK